MIVRAKMAHVMQYCLFRRSGLLLRNHIIQCVTGKWTVDGLTKEPRRQRRDTASIPPVTVEISLANNKRKVIFLTTFPVLYERMLCW